MISPIRSKLFLNSFSLALTQFAGRLIRFFYMLVVARMLGPAETGVYLYGVALYLGVMGICQFGQNAFMAQRLGKQGGTPLSVLHHGLTLVLAATLSVAGLLTAFVWATEPVNTNRATILCFVAALVARSSANWIRAAYVAFERPGWIPKYELSFRSSEALAGIAALLAGGGLFAISFLHFVFWAIEAGFSCRKLAREHPGALGLAWRWAYMKKVIGTSAVVVVSLVAMGQLSQIAVILLRQLQPDEALIGRYGIAMQFLTAMLIVPVSFSQAFLPRLSRAYRRGDGGRDLVTAVKLIVLMALGASVVGGAYGPWFISLVLGPKYAETAELFHWLCWAFTPFAITVFLGQSMNVIGGRVQSAVTMVCVAALHAGLLVAFVDRSPAVAAIGSLAVASSAGMLAMLHQAGMRLRVHPPLWWLKPLAVIIGTYAVFEGGWAPLTVTAPAALLAAVALTWLLRLFDDADRMAISRLLRRQDKVPT